MRKFVLSLFALTVLVSPSFAGQYNKVVSVGQKAPDFSGIPATIKGEEASLTLGDIKEDVIVLVFLGNHCPYVVAIEDRLNDFVDAYKGKSVKLIGVSVNDLDSDKLPAIKEWVKEKGSKYTYGYDETQAIGKAYGNTNTPQFFVLDKDRTIQYMGAYDDSPMNEAKASKNYVKAAVDQLLAGESVEVKETRPVGCGVKYKK